MTHIAFAGVGVDFGATNLFSDLSFTVAPGERWGTGAFLLAGSEILRLTSR